MKRSFDEIMSSLTEGLATYAYFVDFNKVFKHVKNAELNLNIMNYLIGKDNFDEAFDYVVKQHPDVVTMIPVLLAVRNQRINILDKAMIHYDFSQYHASIDYLKFVKETKLIELFYDKRIKNLVDYVTGVEVGLDSNGRKNRSGKIMSELVKSYLNKVENIDYIEEATVTKVYQAWGIEIKNDSVAIKSNKRFDFAVKNSKDKVFLIEVNYYGASGSKLNETARSYAKLSYDIKQIPQVTFIWVTDGKGWLSARKNLEESYYIIDHLYTILDLENHVLNHVING